jgi:DNA-directed RNA polymerase specialized sigma24 family protein
LDAEVFILAHKGWFIKVARQIAASSLVASEDLTQEGIIKVWQVWQKHPNQSDYYYLKSAKRRMEDIAYGHRPMIGEDRNQGTPVNPLNTGTDSFDKNLGEDLILADIIPSSEVVEDNDIAYHRKEIYDAINTLTLFQRSTVFRKFWLMDIEPKDFGNWQKIKPKLRESLQHLETAV